MKTSLSDKNKLLYWPAFVDLMSAFFIAILALFFFVYISQSYLSFLVGEGLNDLEDLNNVFQTEEHLKYNDGKIVVSQDILFDRNSYTLSGDGKNILQDVGQKLKAYLSDKKKNYSIIVEGHTDTKGSEKLNRNLSFRRAEVVVNFWENKLNFGIKSDPNIDLIPAGYGEHRLAIQTANNQLESRNRRIEIRIIPKFDQILEEIILNNDQNSN